MEVPKHCTAAHTKPNIPLRYVVCQYQRKLLPVNPIVRSLSVPSIDAWSSCVHDHAFHRHHAVQVPEEYWQTGKALVAASPVKLLLKHDLCEQYCRLTRGFCCYLYPRNTDPESAVCDIKSFFFFFEEGGKNKDEKRRKCVEQNKRTCFCPVM